MTEMMRCLVKDKSEVGLWMQKRPIPKIGPEDVLIRIRKTGICGTDIHIWNWDDWSRKAVSLGIITGHEFSGEIVEIGANVKDLKLGQRCSGEGHLIGNKSRQARAGTFHLDPETMGVGVNTDGAFAEYIPFSDVFLTIAIVLFAVSTMISWSYYGIQSWKFLFGRGKVADLTYKLTFLTFIVIGSAASMNSIWAFSDAMIFAMVFPNMIGLYFLFPVVKEQLNKYLEAIKK